MSQSESMCMTMFTSKVDAALIEQLRAGYAEVSAIRMAEAKATCG